MTSRNTRCKRSRLTLKKDEEEEEEENTKQSKQIIHTEEQLADVIRNNDLSFSEIDVLYMKEQETLPRMIKNIPVWRFACLEGNAGFYVADLINIRQVLDSTMNSSTLEGDDNHAVFYAIQRNIPPLTKNGEQISWLVKEKDKHNMYFTTQLDICVKSCSNPYSETSSYSESEEQEEEDLSSEEY